jgi:flavin reductase (DIM6/NTAB) family NADH-FMN oxidoreductase RutF
VQEDRTARGDDPRPLDTTTNLEAMTTTSQRAIDTAAFTDRTDYPLTVVTTIGPDGELSGCLAGFTTQCSIEPLRFLVCISRANHTFEVISRATILGLHLLGDDQDDTASRFGEFTGDRVDKFHGLRWHPGPGGVPVLDECVAWMAAGIIGRFDVGDHEAQFVYPIDAQAGPATGLLLRSTAPDLQAGHPAG